MFGVLYLLMSGVMETLGQTCPGVEQRYCNAYRCADTDIIQYPSTNNPWYDDDPNWWITYAVCIAPDYNIHNNVYKLTTHADGPEWFTEFRGECDTLAQFSIYDVLQNNNVLSNGWSVKYTNPQVDVSTLLGNMPCNQHAFDVLKIDPHGNLERTCPCYARAQCGQYTTWLRLSETQQKSCTEQLLWQCDPNNCNWNFHT